MKYFLSIFLLLISMIVGAQTKYYVDNTEGNDDSNGTSPQDAWKSLRRIEDLVLQPGDSLLFKSGGEWTGSISPKGSGAPGNPVVIGKYGGDERPLIHGAGLATNTISLVNQHHIELHDLGVTNQGEEPEFRRAIYYEAQNIGAIYHVVFNNLEIYDVNGVVSDESSKDNGGIFLAITGNSFPTWFDTLIISNCHIHDVNRTGISNRSEWDSRTLNNNENWTPSRNIHIHHNRFERTGANALIVRVAHKPLMEYNLFKNCCITGSGNASFSFNTDSAIWQYNEACFTKFNEGDNDAGGFDSDFRSKHTIIQYNYSHDNEYGGTLITGGPGTGTGFNEGTIIRYNVFANNKHHIIRTSGNATNTRIYNNVFFTGENQQDVRIVWHKSWGDGLSDETYYWNNIYYNKGTNSSFSLGSSTRNFFSHNLYDGNTFQDRPIDPAGIYADPHLLDPGGDKPGFEGVSQYAIMEGSEAIDKGDVIEGNVEFDLAGNSSIVGSAPDIGAFEYQETTSGQQLMNQLDKISVYPNPATDFAVINIHNYLGEPILVNIYNARLSLVDQLYAGQYHDSDMNISTSDLDSGFYFFEFRIEERSIMKRFIKL